MSRLLMNAVRDYGPQLSEGFRAFMEDQRRRMLLGDEQQAEPDLDFNPGPSRAQILTQQRDDRPDSLSYNGPFPALAMASPIPVANAGRAAAGASGMAGAAAPLAAAASSPGAMFSALANTGPGMVAQALARNEPHVRAANMLFGGGEETDDLDAVRKAIPSHDQLMKAIGQDPKASTTLLPAPRLPGDVAQQNPNDGLGFAVPAGPDLMRNIALRNLSSGLLSANPDAGSPVDKAAATLPHVSTIRNMQGDLLSQMGYMPDGQGGYNPGQLMNRRGGYENGRYVNPVQNGQEIERGPLTAQDMYRDSLERNLNDRRFSPFGYGIDPVTATQMTAREMAPVIADRENEMRAQEGHLNRQAQFQLEEQRAKRARNDSIAGGMLTQAYNYAQQRGLSPAEAMQYAKLASRNALAGFEGGSVPSVGGPAPATGGTPGDQIRDFENRMSQDDASESTLKKLLTKMPSDVGVTIGQDRGKPVTLQGALKVYGKMSPDQERELFNQWSGSNQTPDQMADTLKKLRQTPAGEVLAQRLLVRAISDDMGAVNPVKKGWIQDTYPERVNFPDRPGISLKNIGTVGGNSMRRNGKPEWEIQLEGGQTLQTDVYNSTTPAFAILGAGNEYRQRLAQQAPFRNAFVQAYMKSNK